MPVRKMRRRDRLTIFPAPRGIDAPCADLADIEETMRALFMRGMPTRGRRGFWSYHGVDGADFTAIPPDRLSIIEGIFRRYGRGVMLAVKQYCFFTMH
jgi:hypothetical protein